MTRVVFGRRAAACDRRAAVAPMGLRGSGGRSGLRGARAFVARLRPIRVTAQAVARARVRAGLRRVGESFVRRARPAACKMSSRARGARARTGRRSYVSRPLRPLRVFATHGRAHACRPDAGSRRAAPGRVRRRRAHPGDGIAISGTRAVRGDPRIGDRRRAARRGRAARAGPGR
ncbi:hypothetical protein ADU20_15895 [Burkholderia pseudomallei]|nr:hypothetical protein ADU20_15895 [Burkholderia pseudomallei]